MRVGLIAMALAGGWLSAAAPAAAQQAEPGWYDNDFQSCALMNTADLVQCVGRLAAAWDRRLNLAYQDHMAGLPEAQRTRLRDAQRLWIRYRDANCAFYANGEGSISRVQAAECMRIMTAQRTRELEQGLGE